MKITTNHFASDAIGNASEGECYCCFGSKPFHNMKLNLICTMVGIQFSSLYPESREEWPIRNPAIVLYAYVSRSCFDPEKKNEKRGWRVVNVVNR